MSSDMTVHCTVCTHTWPLVTLPLDVTRLVNAMKKARCPECGARAKKIELGSYPKPTPAGDAIAWVTGGDTGTSSLTIWSVLMGQPAGPAFSPDIPYDPADFGRCYGLLNVMPAWRARLGEVASAFPRWAPLVAAWDELTSLYEQEQPTGVCPRLYARMRELRGEA